MGIDHDVEVVDVFQPPPAIFAVNPLARVPVLKLETGECIVDSAQIFTYLKETHGSHALFQTGGQRLPALLTHSGVALGVIEGVIDYFLETLRPEALRLSQDLQEYERMVRRGLQYLEDHIAEGPWFTGEQLRACDFDIGTALEYSQFRLNAQILETYPRLSAYFARLSERPSFQTTRPS
jgi:glutathione S-transferase